ETNERGIQSLGLAITDLYGEVGNLRNRAKALEERTEELDEAIKQEVSDRLEAIESLESQIKEAEDKLRSEATANKEELQEKLAKLQTELNEESQKLEDLTGRIETNERGIQSLGLAITDLYGEVGNLRNRAKALEERTEELDEAI
ncbi:hypothetical protein B8A42_07150, partial [Dolosigranulum pigrum]|uniref:hypothetical protein n=1 Tax=Dolosigranulum pigrum TaxID=29394 RepID=UPI000DBFF3E0